MIYMEINLYKEREGDKIQMVEVESVLYKCVYPSLVWLSADISFQEIDSGWSILNLIIIIHHHIPCLDGAALLSNVTQVDNKTLNLFQTKHNNYNFWRSRIRLNFQFNFATL